MKAVVTLDFTEASLLLSGLLLLEDEINHIKGLSPIEKHRIKEDIPSDEDIMLTMESLSVQKKVLERVLEELGG